MEPFAWVLIVGIFVGKPDGGVVQVEVPMVSQQACEAAEKELHVKRDKGVNADWLGSICEPKR